MPQRESPTENGSQSPTENDSSCSCNIRALCTVTAWVEDFSKAL